MNLTVEEKHFILFTKGHYSKYQEPEKVIIGEALFLYPSQVSERNILNYSIKIFDKLMRNNCIQGVNNEPFAWIINEMNNIGRQLKAPNLQEFLFSHIQNSIVENLREDVDIELMKSKMTLIQKIEPAI